MKIKEFKTAPAAQLVDLVAECKMTHAELGEVVGVTGQSISKWIRDGEMPAYMTHVCAALTRRQAAPQRAAILVAGDADRVMTVKRLTEDLKLEVVLLDVLHRR